MKKSVVVLLAGCLCLLAACMSMSSAGGNAAVLQERSMPPSAEAAYEQPEYLLTPMSEESIVRVEGQQVASCKYQLLTLSVDNADALSPADAEDAQRNADVFNERMDALMDDLLTAGEEMGEAAKSICGEGWFTEAYYDEISAAGELVGELISVRLDSSSYTGGAHPNSYTYSLLFDLRSGQFIDVSQIADDPELFRASAAEKLIEKADALGPEYTEGYWTDYQEIIRSWEAGSVLFDQKGMKVVYSSYELGPYAMGPVAFRLSYEELSDLLGEGGLARLGVEPKAEP